MSEKPRNHDLPDGKSYVCRDLWGSAYEIIGLTMNSRVSALFHRGVSWTAGHFSALPGFIPDLSFVSAAPIRLSGSADLLFFLLTDDSKLLR